MFMEFGNMQEKMRLDNLTNEIHCEECLTVIDPSKVEQIVSDPIVYICPTCGITLDEHGWSWQ